MRATRQQRLFLSSSKQFRVFSILQLFFLIYENHELMCETLLRLTYSFLLRIIMIMITDLIQ